MWEYPIHYDVIVMGGGHAGCEAALAAARMGAHVLLLSMNLDTIGKMSCNPAIGGIGKGHMVREIDALGGEMGKVADRTGIQFRMLNRAKGPAVWAPRAQVDRVAYQFAMKHRLETTPNLEVKQGTIENLLIKSDCVKGVITKEGIAYYGNTVVVSSGTFMRGMLHIGESNFSGGRAGDQPSMGLSKSLEELGFQLDRFKTGTPPRINKRSIDFTLTEEQPGEEGLAFSFDEATDPRLPQVCCYITYTTEETKQIITKNIDRSPMYSGKIQSIGPRYCPSIEDKVIRFADKDRHQIFLEPEGLSTEEVYLNGLSSSLPFDVQLAFIHSIPALRHAEIMRPAYAIEYDYVISGQILATLETKRIEGLFFAGQINGTTGYEEAAAQGLLAGTNAACKVASRSPLVLTRSESYIGVMIDDLITKGLQEPYRMFTSRAEHRLLLRQDNADLRLRKYGYQLGLIDQNRYRRLKEKEQLIEREMVRFAATYKEVDGKHFSLAQLLRRPEVSYTALINDFPESVYDHGEEINRQIDIHLKYTGYIERQEKEVERLSHLEEQMIPHTFDYCKVAGLRTEARQRLSEVKPLNLGQASRISGVTYADISVLLVEFAKSRGPS